MLLTLISSLALGGPANITNVVDNLQAHVCEVELAQLRKEAYLMISHGSTILEEIINSAPRSTVRTITELAHEYKEVRWNRSQIKKSLQVFDDPKRYRAQHQSDLYKHDRESRRVVQESRNRIARFLGIDRHFNGLPGESVPRSHLRPEIQKYLDSRDRISLSMLSDVGPWSEPLVGCIHLLRPFGHPKRNVLGATGLAITRCFHTPSVEVRLLKETQYGQSPMRVRKLKSPCQGVKLGQREDWDLPPNKNVFFEKDIKALSRREIRSRPREIRERPTPTPTPVMEEVNPIDAFYGNSEAD